MPRIKTYLIDTPAHLNDKVIGTNFGNNSTNNWKFEDVWKLFINTGNGIDIEYNDIDGVSLYDYHGGIDYQGSWTIIRYLKSNLGDRKIAKQLGNPSYLNIVDAWVNRAVLTYV
jgi:hypothetical protein|tara:strand:- start:2643 stop:2984 length:342 start_codon:yes stop_codon:yes gene_type:complete